MPSSNTTDDTSGLIPDSAQFIQESTLIQESSVMDLGALDEPRAAREKLDEDMNDGGLPQPQGKAAKGNGASGWKKNAPFAVVGVIATVLIGSVAYKSLVGESGRGSDVVAQQTPSTSTPSEDSQTLIVKPMQPNPTMPQMPPMPPTPALQPPTTTITTTTTTSTPNSPTEAQPNQPTTPTNTVTTVTATTPTPTPSMPVISMQPTSSMPPVASQPTFTPPVNPPAPYIPPTVAYTPPVTPTPTVGAQVAQMSQASQASQTSQMPQDKKPAGPTSYDLEGAEKVKALTERVAKLEAAAAVTQEKLAEAMRKGAANTGTQSAASSNGSATAAKPVASKSAGTVRSAPKKYSASSDAKSDAKAPASRSTTGYSVTAAKDNLVWLRGSDGEIQSFTVGEEVPGLGRLTSVDESTLSAVAGGKRIR